MIECGLLQDGDRLFHTDAYAKARWPNLSRIRVYSYGRLLAVGSSL